MNKLKELMDARADKHAEASALVDLAKERAHTAEERSQFDALSKEMDDLDEQIKHEQRLISFRAGKAATVGTGADGNRDVSKQDERDMSKYNLNRALLAKVDQRALDGIEAEIQAETEKRATEEGIELSANSIVVLDSVLQKRGQTVTLQTTNPGDQGGVTVDTTMKGVLELMYANTFLDKVGAKTMTGLTGNVKFSVQETAPTIQELTEIEEMDDDEILWSSFGMSPKRRGTTIPISRQLLIQSSLDMQNVVIDQIGIALGQKANAEAIANILTAITSGNGNLIALGTNGAAPIYANVVALKALIDGFNHLHGSPKFLTNSKVQAQLELTQKFTGTDGTTVWKEGNTVAGYPAVVSNIVPSNLVKGTATNASAIIFGNFADFYMGAWGGTEYIVDPFSAKKKGQIEITVNAFWDQKIARVKSFAGIKDALTPLS